MIKECRAYALAHPDLRGIWGGRSAKERRQLRAQSPPAPSATPGGPSKARPAGSLQRTLERLAAHPGRWARVARYPAPTSAAAVASRLRRGHLPAPPGSWRFEARRNQVGGSDLYARLVGSPAAGPDGGTKP